ncbi:MAG: putative glycoside hydrolase [Patescibacteria group bacterium]
MFVLFPKTNLQIKLWQKILAGSLILAAFFSAILLPLKSLLAVDLLSYNFPRTVNLYWKTPITQEEAVKLAAYDLLALDMQAQSTSQQEIKLIRKLNPRIVILAYTSANEIPLERLSVVEPQGAGLWHTLAKESDPRWQLKTVAGENISFWPGNISMNLYVKNRLGKSYADYLADFYQNKVLATGLWDGLLLDNVWQNVSWVNSRIDIDADGYLDSAEKIDRLWQEGYKNLFKNLRNKFGDKYLIVGNGDGPYLDLNGRMFEGFPEYWEGGWDGSMKRYRDTNNSGYLPRLNIINVDTDNTGNRTNYQLMRFGLASALLYNGYYGFNFGTQLREHFWWYDEYDVNLGPAKSSPKNLLTSNNNLQPGLWQRDFANGVAIVNSTDKKQTVSFDSEYEKIHGIQDPEINNGSRLDKLSLEAGDGVILLRPLAEIEDGVFANGSFARPFNAYGHTVRNGFFAYVSLFLGGNKISKTDLNNDGQKEFLVAAKNKITIYNSAQENIAEFYPYGSKFAGGLSLAVADLDNDGWQEIITGPETGGANLVKIFNWQGKTKPTSFYAYNKAWTKMGVNVAAGDVNGDGQSEIVVGASSPGGPHVKIFDNRGKLLSMGFFAYDKKFAGGVNVACGDVNGDGQDEIITGPGFGGSPEIKIFNQQGRLLNSWLAYNPQKREGVKPLASDIDSDGQAEILALTTNVFTTSFIEKNNNFEYAAN